MKYPKESKVLVSLLNKDQKQVREYARLYSDKDTSVKVLQGKKKKLHKGIADRTSKLMSIIEYISEPTVQNIGTEGQTAVAVLALHSNLEVMEKVLSHFEKEYTANPRKTVRKNIPALVDKVSIVKNKKQVFGTQWLLGEDGVPFMYGVEDFNEMILLRNKYGLHPAQKPTDLSTKKFNIKNLTIHKKDSATIYDQRMPTKKERDEFIAPYLNRVDKT